MLSAQNKKIYIDFFAAHVKTSDSDSVPIHFHEDVEIYFLLNGGKECFIDNKLYKINAGDILIFKPNQIHKIVRDDTANFERYVMAFKLSFLMDILTRKEFYVIRNLLNNNESIIFSPTEEEFKKISELLFEYIKLSSEELIPDLFFPTLKQIKFLEMIIYIFTIFQNHKNSKQKSLTQDSLMNPILDYLEKNFVTANLDSLAEHFNLSKSYLCVLFKKNTAMTINNYISSKKIIYAKKLLAEGKNVTETTELCGFSDSTDFSRVFKKYTNLSPKKYQMSLKIWK